VAAGSCTLLLVPEVPSGRKVLAVARSVLFVPEDGSSWFPQNISNSQITLRHTRHTAAFKFVLPEISAVTPFIMVSSVSVVTRPRTGHSVVRLLAGARNYSFLQNVYNGCGAAVVFGEAEFDW
jgi:hypothetical protein